MIWMLVAMTGAAPMPSPGHGHSAMAPMPRASLPVPVQAASVLFAAWDRTRLDSRQGAAIWRGHAVLAHNLVKIETMAR